MGTLPTQLHGKPALRSGQPHCSGFNGEDRIHPLDSARPRTRSFRLPLLLILASLLGTGCVNSGAFFATNLTNVELGEGNYRVVATNVTGQSEAGYILGFSGSLAGYATTFAFLRVEGDGLLYKAAVENLWAGFEADHGPVKDRRLALINVHFDADAANYLGFYSKSVVSVRADVIEFDQ